MSIPSGWQARSWKIKNAVEKGRKSFWLDSTSTVASQKLFNNRKQHIYVLNFNFSFFIFHLFLLYMFLVSRVSGENRFYCTTFWFLQFASAFMSYKLFSRFDLIWDSRNTNQGITIALKRRNSRRGSPGLIINLPNTAFSTASRPKVFPTIQRN